MPEQAVKLHPPQCYSQDYHQGSSCDSPGYDIGENEGADVYYFLSPVIRKHWGLLCKSMDQGETIRPL